MSEPAREVNEWDQLHSQWAEKESAHNAAWRDYLRLSEVVNTKQAATLRGHPEASPSNDEIARVRDAKSRWEAIARELAALSERMTRA